MDTFSKYFSLLLLLFLLFNCFVGAQLRVDYQGERSNYGETSRAHVDHHLKTIPHAQSMSHEEELFYLFKFHDIDRNGYLDGHELWNALTDFGDEPTMLLSELTTMVDHILREDDLDNDGMISLDEYWISNEYHQTK